MNIYTIKVKDKKSLELITDVLLVSNVIHSILPITEVFSDYQWKVKFAGEDTDFPSELIQSATKTVI